MTQELHKVDSTLRVRALLLGLASLFLSAGGLANNESMFDLAVVDLAVVIDDVGYNKSRGLRAIQLPAEITIAILPFAPHTQKLASAANKAGKDLIIHQPMEAIPAPHVRREHDTLTTDMSPAQFDAAIERAIAAVPLTRGFSNHTGSLLTTQREPMRRFMQHLSHRNMLFLDSRTTAQTVALQVANEFGVPAIRRDVFLDHERTTSAIEDAFAKAIRIARQRGYAVVVGHPYPVTLDFLERTLLELPSDINLIGISELTAKRHALRSASTNLRELALGRDQVNLHISLGQ